MNYLDNAAATPLDDGVLKAMQPYFSNKFFNPSATYLPARDVKIDLDTARKEIAELLGARAPEIIFTAGATEANNLAVQGVLKAYPHSNIVLSSIEHESVIESAKQYKVKQIKVDTDGIVNPSDVLNEIDEHTVLVSIMYANNEIGTIQPLTKISQIIRAVRKERIKTGNRLPLYFHSDAAQAANYLDLHVSRLGVDLMTLNGSKIYGPKQTGSLYVASSVRLQPLVFGGGQERGLRSGTENVAGSIGFAKALVLAQETRQTETKRLLALQKLCVDLMKAQIPSVTINGSQNRRLPNNIHITIPGEDNERLVMKLEEHDIYCAVGSACSASKEQPSHVLKAIGLTDDEATASLRISMGRATTAAAIRQFAEALASIVK